MSQNYTITGTYTLPSYGKIYKNKTVNPEVTLRSMTTAEEMKRLNPSDRAYKVMADIIDDCTINDIGISAYYMHLGDYMFLLHRIRVITYGKNYMLSSTCPYCGSILTDMIDLEELPIIPYTEEIEKYFEINLPKTEHSITLKMQTPRMLDDIIIRAKEMRKKSPTMTGDPSFLLSVEMMIDKIDGKEVDVLKKADFVRNLPMMDTNYILTYGQKLNK